MICDVLRSRRLFPLLALAAGLPALAGCGKSEAALVPVTGRVLIDGKPAVGAAVVLHPVSSSGEGTRPLGQVDEKGEFRLTTVKDGDGAAPGEYRVTLTRYVSGSPAAGKRAEGDEGPARNLIPDKYARADSTPVTVTIRPEGNEPLRIDITTRR